MATGAAMPRTAVTRVRLDTVVVLIVRLQPVPEARVVPVPFAEQVVHLVLVVWAAAASKGKE